MTLDLVATITSPSGLLVLEGNAGYELQSEAFGQRAVSHRKTEVSSPWIAGTFTVRSVRENISSPVNVWITEPDDYLRAGKVDALTDAFDQLIYTLTLITPVSRETWTCTTADYTLVENQAYRNAGMVLLQAQVPHLPHVLRVAVP